jgi:hypothetical protein
MRDEARLGNAKKRQKSSKKPLSAQYRVLVLARQRQYQLVCQRGGIE